MDIADDCQTKHFHDSEKKYFTPDMEDICIGYELEMNWNRAYEERWVPIKILIQNEEFVYTDELSEIINALDDGMSEARVPYLTKEQLEVEGWKQLILNDNEQALLLFSKNGHDLRIYENYIFRFSELIVGMGMMPSWDKVLFEGKCKDINTFRKICKLLEIQ